MCHDPDAVARGGAPAGGRDTERGTRPSTKGLIFRIRFAKDVK
jgi:hypothetical protein